jgi:hypothetical protein
MAKRRRPGRERSTYTEELRFPGGFEGETVTRAAIRGPNRSRGRRNRSASDRANRFGVRDRAGVSPCRASWQQIGPLSRFTDSTYVPVTITIEPGVGEAGRSLAYVCRRNPSLDGPAKDRYDHGIALCARGLPCPLRRGGRIVRVPVPRPGSTMFAAFGPAVPAATAGPLLHADLRRPGAPRSTLQRELGAQTLRAARPRPASRRDRPVPIPTTTPTAPPGAIS